MNVPDGLGPFLWFGGELGKPLPPLGDKVSRHSKGNKDGYKAEWLNIREVCARASSRGSERQS
jgi:hypothetical protein